MALNDTNEAPHASSNSPVGIEPPSKQAPVFRRFDIRPERTLFSKFRFVFRHLWIVGLSVVAGLLLSFGYIAKTTPIYRATTVLKVAERQQHSFTSENQADNGEDDLRDDSVLNTLIESFKLDSLYLRAANDPSLQQDTNLIPAAEDQRPSPADLAGRIKHETSVILRRGTRLLDVNVEDPSPKTAQLLSTTVVAAFVATSGDGDISTASAKRQFLVDETDRVKKSLQKAEDGLQVYKEALRQKQRVDDQQKVIDDLTQRYLDAHPKLIEARSLMNDIKQNFDAEIKKVIANSPVEAAYWAQAVTVQPNENPVDVVNQELKAVEARTNVLQNEVDTESALFANLLKQMRDQDVQSESAPTDVKVMDVAKLPTAPVRPNSQLIIRNGLLGGLLLGIAIIIILQRLDSTFASAEEVEQITELPVVAIVPILPRSSAAKRKKKAATSPLEDEPLDDLVLISDPSGVAAENIRNLWAALELVGKEEDRRTMMFSSALPGEGKTFTSCNYAVSLAQHGSKTLLIDADLRRPSVHTRFRLKNDRPGLTEHVGRGTPLSEVVIKSVEPNLHIMLTGGKCPNPAEFLSGNGFVETLQRALRTYDRVVVDSPPIIPVGDTRLIAPYVQTVYLVVRAESTSRHAVRRSINFLEMVNVRPVGIVYNCVPSWSMDEYHGYSYSQKYKYGEAYGANSDSKSGSLLKRFGL
jgi:capsular exopolysaccharide synthesis family protein